MSGLEPLVALGLTCNILQVIGVGRETVRIARQVYQDRKFDPTLMAKAALVRDLSSQIRTTASAATSSARGTTPAAPGAPPPRPKPRDKQLMDLADECTRAARDLQEEVNFLNDQHSRLQLLVTLKIAAKTVWRKGRLVRLDKELDLAERKLQMGLLTRIYERAERTDTGLAALDANLRSFLNEYRKGHTEVSKLVSTLSIQSRTHVTTETKKSEDAVKSHITHHSRQTERSLAMHIDAAVLGIAQCEQDARIKAKREVLVGSLKFDRMNERRNRVAASHPRTFRWVLKDGSDGYESSGGSGKTTSDPLDFEMEGSESHFGNSDESLNCSAEGLYMVEGRNATWDSFSDWLRSTEKLYWISGKLGSGKTTLMKFLLGQSSTRNLLDSWKPDAIIISHFFWRPGTQMQQSIRGLLCSLLHQLLVSNEASIDHILSSGINAAWKKQESDWSGEELESTLRDTMARYPKPIVMFIDGLDEVLPSDGTKLLIDLMNTLANSYGKPDNVKICVGSRREPLIQRRLNKFPQLRLENLNKNDLLQYAKNNIIIHEDYDTTTFDDNNCYNDQTVLEWLVEELVERAEGVFLWLCLTVKSITKALHQGEAVANLEQRVLNLPTDLVHLYTEMWNRNNDDGVYLQNRASLYLQLLVCSSARPSSTLAFIIASNPGMACQILETQSPGDEFAAVLLLKCNKTMQDIEIRCAGLIECELVPKVGNYESYFEQTPWDVDNYSELVPYLEESLRILNQSMISVQYASLKLLEAELAIRHLLKEPPHNVLNPYDPPPIYQFRNKWSFLRFLLKDIEDFSRLPPPEDGGLDVEFESSRLLEICEKLFNSGRIFVDVTIALDKMQLDVELPSQFGGLLTSYMTMVMRKHEFLLQMAAANCDLWPFLITAVETRQIDNNTLSELLLHACNIESPYQLRDAVEAPAAWLGFSQRLSFVKLLLERGASRCWKGRRVVQRISPITQMSALETPLTCLLSRIWFLNLTPEYLHFTQSLLTKEYEDLTDFHVVHLVRNGLTGPVPLAEAIWGWGRFAKGREMWLVVTYTIREILCYTISSWASKLAEKKSVWDMLNSREIEPGRLTGLIDPGFGKSLAYHRNIRFYPVKPEEDLENEVSWTMGVVDRMMRENRAGGFSPEFAVRQIPEEVEEALFRALERKKLERENAAATEKGGEQKVGIESMLQHLGMGP